MDIKLNKFLFIFFIFSIHLVPFANKVSFETFPILLLLLVCYIFFIKGINLENYINENKITFLFILYLILFFIVNFWNENNNLLELTKYLIGPIMLFFFRDFKNYFRINEILFFGFLIILLNIVFLFKIPILFNISCNSLEFFISRLDCSNSLNLNRPFLITPEPSYLSLLLSFYLIILNFFKQNITKKKQKLYFFIVEILICYIIFSTSSRVGIFFLFFYVTYYFYLLKLYKNIYTYFFLFGIVIYLILFLNLNFFQSSKSFYKENIINSRNILNLDYIISRSKNNLQPLLVTDCSLIKNQIYYNDDSCHIENSLLAIINTSEPTGFIRILHNYLSLQSSFEKNLVGQGFGSYANLWYQYAKKYNVEKLLKSNEVAQKWYPNVENKKQYIQNYFFSILHDGGLIPAFLILILIYKSLINVIRNKYTFGYVIIAYIVVTFFFQSTITSPYPWLSLGLILFNEKKYA